MELKSFTAAKLFNAESITTTGLKTYVHHVFTGGCMYGLHNATKNGVKLSASSDILQYVYPAHHTLHPGILNISSVGVLGITNF
jgi:hypothetical protein